jgi:hypothetical protein
MVNAWIAHLKKFHKEHPEISYKEAMGKAKHSYSSSGATKTHKVKKVIKKMRKSAKKSAKKVKKVNRKTAKKGKKSVKKSVKKSAKKSRK